MNAAEKRAEMPKGTNTVLDRRTLAKDNANLLHIIKPAQTVLDVGCGSGSITKGMTELVGTGGYVVGIDVSKDLIDIASNNFGDIKNLQFEVADINTYSFEKNFDVISSARVLQWVSNPRELLIKMKSLLKPNGCITILDYNHEMIQFTPDVPKIFKTFYDAFLQWRKDAGMNNAIADDLKEMFESIGLKNVSVEDQSEISQHGSDTFTEEIAIWKKVAEMRGKQLVTDGYITESQRQSAALEYQSWIEKDARFMKLYLRAVTGYN